MNVYRMLCPCTDPTPHPFLLTFLMAPDGQHSTGAQREGSGILVPFKDVYVCGCLLVSATKQFPYSLT